MNLLEQLRDADGLHGGDALAPLCHRAADEIERLRALVKLAADAYETGGEDDCCVACSDIARAVAAEQKEPPK